MHVLRSFVAAVQNASERSNGTVVSALPWKMIVGGRRRFHVVRNRAFQRAISEPTLRAGGVQRRIEQDEGVWFRADARILASLIVRIKYRGAGRDVPS